MEGYQCSLCTKTFGRHEHLRRHEQSHKDPQFHCVKCSKAFHRKDALNKHEQTHGSAGASLLLRGARACSTCASMKSRCTGTLPCARCNNKGLQCVYPATRSRSATANLIAPQEERTYVPGDTSSPQALQPQVEQGSDDFSAYAPPPQQTQYDSIANQSPAPQSLSQQLPAEILVQQPSYNTHTALFYPPGSENATVLPPSWTANALSTINWLESDITSFNDDDLNNLFAFPDEFSFSPSIDLVSPSQQYNVETPTNDLLPNPIAPQRLPPIFADTTSFPQASPVPDSSTVADKSTVASGEYYIDGEAGRLPRSKRRKIVSRSLRLDHVETLEFSLEYRFPATTCPEPKLMLSEEVYTQLYTLHRQLCLDTMIFKPFLHSGFPTKPALEGLLFNYFSHFDQTMPFLYFPKFVPESSHCGLLLAMMALGSCFIDGEDTETFTLSMHELVRRYLLVREEQRYGPLENSQMLAQMQLLHAIGAGYTQVEPLRTSASRSLDQATRFCRETWALQKGGDAPERSHDNDSSEWKAWVKNEEMIRTGFCIWLLDCMWAFHFQQPPYLSLDHAADMPLPCSERLWSAKDVHDWKRLTALGISHTSTLLEGLQNLYIDKRLLPNLGEFTRIILIHGLFHRTWEVRATVTQRLSNFEPAAQKQASSDIEPRGPIWPPSVPLFNRWRNSACDCLDILHWRANETIGAASGIEHPTVLHLHLARIILLAPVRDLILFSHHLIRSSKDATRLFPSVSSKQAEEHRRLIQRWVLQDQYKARLAAIHAGVVFWHVRLYSINGFYEPMAVAFAALVLWSIGAFSTKRSAPRSKSRRGGTSTPSEPVSPPSDVCDIILIDRPTDDELVQQFVRQGDEMHVNLTGVGDLFGQQGPRKVLAQSQKLLGTLRSWRSITEYWLKVLSQLEKVTAMVGVDSNAAGEDGTVAAG